MPILSCYSEWNRWNVFPHQELPQKRRNYLDDNPVCVLSLVDSCSYSVSIADLGAHDVQYGPCCACIAVWLEWYGVQTETYHSERWDCGLFLCYPPFQLQNWPLRFDMRLQWCLVDGLLVKVSKFLLNPWMYLLFSLQIFQFQPVFWHSDGFLNQKVRVFIIKMRLFLNFCHKFVTQCANLGCFPVICGIYGRIVQLVCVLMRFWVATWNSWMFACLVGLLIGVIISDCDINLTLIY